MFRRKDNAMECYVGDEFVGWMLNIDDDGLRRGPVMIQLPAVSLGSLSYPSEFSIDGDVIEVMRLETERRSFAIMAEDEIRYGKEHVERTIVENVPSYATSFRDSFKDILRFEWFAIKMKLSDFEVVFDLSEFEPYDNGEPDMDSKRFSAMKPSSLTLTPGTLAEYSKKLKEKLAGEKADTVIIDDGWTTCPPAKPDDHFMRWVDESNDGFSSIPFKPAEAISIARKSSASIIGRRVGKTLSSYAIGGPLLRKNSILNHLDRVT